MVEPLFCVPLVFDTQSWITLSEVNPKKKKKFRSITFDKIDFGLT